MESTNNKVFFNDHFIKLSDDFIIGLVDKEDLNETEKDKLIFSVCGKIEYLNRCVTYMTLRLSEMYVKIEKMHRYLVMQSIIIEETKIISEQTEKNYVNACDIYDSMFNVYDKLSENLDVVHECLTKHRELFRLL